MTNSGDDRQKTVKDLLEYGKSLKNERENKKVDFVGSEKTPERQPANKLLLQNPFAFLLAVIYDQGQKAEQSWRYPYELCKAINSDQPDNITEEQLIEFISSKNLLELDCIFKSTEFQLRDWRTACPDTIRAVDIVLKKYNGKTSQIWEKGNPCPREITRRLQEFSGIAQKKGTMTPNILYRDLGWIDGNNLDEIDVSYDRHIRRIFLRTGLSNKGSLNRIVNAARELNPSYPGALDLPAWRIGRDYCDNRNPNCNQCPLTQKCSEERKERYHVQ